MTEKKPGLFDKLYAASKEALDAMKKPIIRNKVKRRLSAAYDDADLKINEFGAEIQKVRENFDDYNVNKVLELKAKIEQAKKLKNDIKEEYLELFAKEMVVEEENDED